MTRTLNENIKSLRIAMGLNQVEFGRAIGVTKQCVSNWENDNVVPSIDMLIKLADFFNITTHMLLGRGDRASLDVSGLTDEQIGHLALLINDLKKARH